MIQRLPFSHPATAGDVGRLCKLLREALTGLAFHRAGKIAVLNLACGRADETGALAAALAPTTIGHYLGIDLRTDTVAEAARRWQLQDGLIEFRSGDASAIDRMKLLPPFDFIFIRHQNYWDDPASWDPLLKNALAALAPGGLLVCTSYFDREHELMKAALKTRGAEILWDIRHRVSRPLPDALGKSVDRWLAVFGNGMDKERGGPECAKLCSRQVAAPALPDGGQSSSRSAGIHPAREARSRKRRKRRPLDTAQAATVRRPQLRAAAIFAGVSEAITSGSGMPGSRVSRSLR